MILIDLAEWIVNLFILSMGLVILSMGLFMITLLVYSIQDWRGK